MQTIFTVLLIISCITLIVLVLLQSGKSAGLSGAISGGAEHLFGKQKARGVEAILQKVTIGVAIAFFILSIAVSYFA